MQWSVPVLLLSAIPAIVQAGDSSDAAAMLSQLNWEKRVVLVFAPMPQNTLLRQQQAIFGSTTAELRERDLTIFEIVDQPSRLQVDGQPASVSAAAFQQLFQIDPDAFRVFLIGKDGGIKLDQTEVVTAQALFALIDAMPMRQREMSEDG